MHQTTELAQRYHSFRTGRKSPLRLQQSDIERNYCVIRRELLQSLSLASKTGITCKVQGLIMPICTLLSRPKIPRDRLHVGSYSWVLSTSRSSIDQDSDTWMPMHFLEDLVMSVVSGVRVGSHRNECLLSMWVFKLWCMSLTRTTSNLWVVKNLLVILVPRPSFGPTWTSTFLREQQEADSDLKVIIRSKEAGKEKPGVCWSLQEDPAGPNGLRSTTSSFHDGLSSC